MKVWIVLAFVLTTLGCSKRDETLDASTAVPPVASVKEKIITPTIEARETASVIKMLYPHTCKVADQDSKWASCHDEPIGFTKMLACDEEALKAAKEDRASLPVVTPTTPCGITTASAIQLYLTSMDAFFEEHVTWMKANAAKIRPLMGAKSLSDVCADDKMCSDEPKQFQGKHQNATYAVISGIECTKLLFQCGRQRDNVCWVNKVADRLGAVCEGSSNKQDDPLRVRATGQLLYP